MKNKKRKNNKKGSASIFLTAILLSMVLVSGFFLEAASGRACRSFGEGVMSLAAESLLTEYQRTLKKDYGLFGFMGEKQTMEDKIHMYSEATFNAEEMDLLRLKLNRIWIDLSDYPLSRLDIFEEEIKRYMKFKGVTLILDETINQIEASNEIKNSNEIARGIENESIDLEAQIKEVENGEKESTDSSENKEKIEKGKRKLRELKNKSEESINNEVSKGGEEQVIRNKSVIEYLPSKSLKEVGGGNYLQSPENLIATTQYILSTFHNALSNEKQREGFYKYETEYIINGNLDDRKNLAAIKREIVAIRLGLNIAHIYTCADKLRKIATVATALTPGPWAPLTQLILTSIWSTVESTNDLKLLMEGKKVPLVKGEKDWAVDLDSILNGAIGGTIGEGKDGLSYNGYLSIMLGVAGRSNILLRTMDIIQINIKGTDDATFKMQDYFVGFKYNGELEKISGFFGPMGESFRKGDITGEIRY